MIFMRSLCLCGFFLNGGRIYENRHCEAPGKVGNGADAAAVCGASGVTVIDQEPQLINNIINVYDVMGICGNGSQLRDSNGGKSSKAELLIATIQR